MEIPSVSRATGTDPTSASILVVDDESKYRASLQKILGMSGFRVDTAGGGAEAKKKLNEAREPYDLVLLDLMMPEFSGHQLLEYIAQRELDVATVVVSGTTSVTEATTAMRQGAQDYLRKPYDVDELLICVQRAIWSHELKRENRTMQARLRQSEHLHSFLVNNSPDLIFALDARGQLTFANDRFRSLLGFAPADLIGRKLGAIVHREDRSEVERFLRDAILQRADTGSVEARLVRAPVSGDTRDETRAWVPCEIRVEVASDTPPEHIQAESGIGIFGTARDQTERKLSEAHIRRLAYYDPLTALPNRQLFQDRLQRALERAHRSGRPLALLFLDLDQFKYTNDTLGHHAGDTLLQEVAKRLLALVRKQDSVARISGDEFVVILEQIRGASDAGVVAQKILDSLAEPYRIDQHMLHISASIGISIFPQDGLDEESLIKHADVAMYRAKEKGRNNFQFYTAEMTRWMLARVEVENRLKQALHGNQLVLYYQPQFELQSGRLVGAEALVRWIDPDRGLLAPDRFLPVAEESGLILQLGEWVLTEACRRTREWQEAGLPLPKISVNISTKQVAGSDIVGMVQNILAETGLASDSLELEITESFFLEPKRGLLHALKSLHRLGVTFSVDDFGTGYSSLSVLKHLPIDKLKIDRSFIRDVPADHNDRAIIRAILAMGESLKLRITAEGVETAEQNDFLRNEGCNDGQGFLYDPPLPEREMTALLAGLRPAAGAKH